MSTTWEKPVVEEIKMDAEIGSYQGDEGLIIEAEEKQAASAAGAHATEAR